MSIFERHPTKDCLSTDLKDTPDGISVGIEPHPLTSPETHRYAIVMRAHRSDLPVYRAVITLAALYALALQAILGGLVPTSLLGSDHVICAPNAGTGDGPFKPGPAHSHLPCCTFAHGHEATSPPLPVVVAIVWPTRRAASVMWRPEIVAAPRAPPGISASARAPPAA
ncbi:hypothetical protein ACQVP2_34315 [Methylobacterium aquaticum]|uniref:hypothetical protein n=1 Tax=Methylobacterium aquaticum TaxID=270351 RepID=UPI003D167B67